MRTSYEILKSIRDNNKKSLRCDEITKRCIRVAMEDVIIKCAGLAHPHWKPQTIRKKIMELINNVE